MKFTLKRGCKALATIILAAPGLSLADTGFSLAGTIWDHAASKYGVEKELLYAIALAESKKAAGSESMRPWPWALNIEGKGYLFETREEAETELNNAIAAGIKSIDVGPMQVNLLWNGFRVERPEDLFDIQTSAMVGAAILSEAMLSSPNDKTIGVGRYHNWDADKARVYGTRVLQYRNAIVQATGGRY